MSSDPTQQPFSLFAVVNVMLNAPSLRHGADEPNALLDFLTSERIRIRHMKRMALQLCQAWLLEQHPALAALDDTHAATLHEKDRDYTLRYRTLLLTCELAAAVSDGPYPVRLIPMLTVDNPRPQRAADLEPAALMSRLCTDLRITPPKNDPQLQSKLEALREQVLAFHQQEQAELAAWFEALGETLKLPQQLLLAPLPTERRAYVAGWHLEQHRSVIGDCYQGFAFSLMNVFDHGPPPHRTTGGALHTKTRFLDLSVPYLPRRPSAPALVWSADACQRWNWDQYIDSGNMQMTLDIYGKIAARLYEAPTGTPFCIPMRELLPVFRSSRLVFDYSQNLFISPEFHRARAEVSFTELAEQSANARLSLSFESSGERRVSWLNFLS